MNGAESTYNRRVKRFLDIAGSTTLLTVSAPALIAIGVAIKLDDGGPILYSHIRSGINGRRFALHKFRTMKVGTDKKYGGYPVESAVTRIGTVLRRTSLDEIPQLWNVFKGEMSFVGPRPAVPEQVARYTEMQRRRLVVRPGVTGAAQVKYRNNATWSQRIEEDVRYVETMSLFTDLKLILSTIPAVFFARGQSVGQKADEVDDLGEPQ